MLSPCINAIKRCSLYQALSREKKLDGGRPPPEYLKLNVDGAICFDNNKAGIEMILKNEHGETIVTASIVEQGVK